MRALGASSNMPLPPSGNHVSIIKVGMFDGGVDTSHPFLHKYVKENHVVKTPPLSDYISHGSAVAGVILYGPLNSYTSGSHLPQPAVSVESFRVFPLNDPTDNDLYEAIDIIEDVVPTREDINVYNLSFGPCGPILDDDISRFTYSLDELAWNYRKLFAVAVGNDGLNPKPLNRIQSPSDLVNGLGVGAFSYHPTTNEIVRAGYSCVGDGREGCKVKPDITAFGGDEYRPIHLLLLNPNTKFLSMGTSYSAPIISGKAGEILGRCTRFSPLVARALLIHSAKHPVKVDNELGYGIIDQSVDEIINCQDNRVTIVYSSSILPTNYAKLPIPVPRNMTKVGTLEISWTIAVLSKVNHLHIDDYTQSAIEDTFYPHELRYRFSRGKKYKVKHIENDASEIQELLLQGWKKSTLPATDRADCYQTEQARRGELKWDTIVRRNTNKRYNSVKNPFLVLHRMGRNGSTDRMDYAVVVIIAAPQYKGSLYEDILAEYQALEPIQIRNVSEVMVPIS